MADNLPSVHEFRTQRLDSTSSAKSTSSTASTRPAPSSPLPRRPSGGLFEGLTAQKRKDDPASMARRKSLSEQRPQVGFLGQMWNTYVRGGS